MGSRFPRRAKKVPTIFFVVWGVFCAATVVLGLWLLHAGLDYRKTHQEAAATVAIENQKAGRAIKPNAHLAYTVNGKSFELVLPPPMSPQDRKKYSETYRPGSQVTVWFLIGQPSVAEVEGDRGTMIGGIVFSGAGIFFGLIGVLAFVAEFYPNRFVRFG